LYIWGTRENRWICAHRALHSNGWNDVVLF
jgi:hypothetical protein